MDKDLSVAENFNRCAALYEDQFMGFDLYNDSYDLFCSSIEKKNPKVLEIGCGPGNVTKYIKGKRSDLELLGIDISEEMIRLAKKNNPEIDFLTMDCRTLSQLKGSFDAVICGFCMPYLTKIECEQLVKDCGQLLVPNGVFYFSTIEDSYANSTIESSSDGKHKMFIYYHEANYLEAFLRKFKFKLIETIRTAYQKADGTNATHLIYIVKKE